MRRPSLCRILADFLLILIGALLLAVLIGLSALQPPWLSGPLHSIVLALRIPLALAFVLYVPGYLLQLVFFPLAADLEGAERFGLSLGLSLALLVLLALLLDRLPWGLSVSVILLGQAVLVLLLLLLALWRRLRQPAAQAYLPEFPPRLARRWSVLPLADRRLLTALGLVLLLALLALAWIFLTPSPNEYMTEFYLLGPAGLAEDFPRQAAVGQPLQVTTGVVNRERDSQTYHIEIWLRDLQDPGRHQQLASFDPFTLAPGQSLEQRLAWSMPYPGPDQHVEFLLFRQGEAQPYRHLRLILDVEPAD